MVCELVAEAGVEVLDGLEEFEPPQDAKNASARPPHRRGSQSLLVDFIATDSRWYFLPEKGSSNNRAHMAGGIHHQVPVVDVNTAPSRCGLTARGLDILAEVASQQLFEIGRETTPGNSKYCAGGRDELPDHGAAWSLHLVDRVVATGNNANRGLQLSLIGAYRGNVFAQARKERGSNQENESGKQP